MPNQILKILLKPREDRTVAEMCSLILYYTAQNWREYNYCDKIAKFTDDVTLLLEAGRLTSDRN